MFNKNRLSQAVLTAVMGAAISAPALAQGTDPLIEEVYVTGIRASLERAMDIKRESSGVVDAIAAEDIGRFPDANLAESLQRISGVSIDRTAGEGNSVTVRGFGPHFNMVTTNGRQMPNSGAGRSFNFNDLAAELVSGVEVQKTSSAANPSGGIGSTINITTAKPLDIGEFRVAGSLKGVTDTEEGSVTPEISGLVSNVFADGTIGVLFAASYQQRKYEQERLAVDGWRVNQDIGAWHPQGPAGAILENHNQTPNTFIAQNYNISVQPTERERTNANLVFQFAPNDDLTVTADYMYSELHVEAQSSQFGVWFNAGGVSDVIINENGTVIQMSENGTFDNIQNWYETVSENQSFGLNVNWDISDNFNLLFDANFAKSEQNPGGEFNQFQGIVGYGNQQTFEIRDGAELPAITNIEWDPNAGRAQAPFCGNPNWTAGAHGTNAQQNCLDWAARNAARYGFDLSDPGYTVDPDDDRYDPNNPDYRYYDDPNHPNNVRASGPTAGGGIAESLLRAHRNDIQHGNTVDKLDQFRLEGTWTEDNVVLSAGLMFTDQSKENRVMYNAHEPRNVVEQLAGMYGYPVLDDLPYGYTTIGSGFLDQFSGNEHLPRQWIHYDPADYFAVIWPQVEEGYSQIPTEWSPTSYKVEEETLATYVQLAFDTEVANMPLHVRTGARFETTEMTSHGNGQVLEALRFTDPTSMAPVYQAGGLTVITESQKYNVLLPSLDLRLDITSDLTARFHAGNSLSRPGIGDLQAPINIGDTRPGGAMTASGGNPALRPFSATNIDLGLEWYYTDLSYMSAGYFLKHIDDFIVGGTTEDTINNVIDPSTGNPAVFSISRPVNGESARVEGIELAIQHTFGDTGFGVGANATMVTTNRELQTEDVNQRFAITGLSDSANLIGFYEQGPFSARLAYNWRDKFLQGFSQLQGGDAVIVEDYGQLDISLGYDITDNISVHLEGINITDEGYRSHGRYKEQLYEAISTGPRYAIGVRATF